MTPYSQTGLQAGMSSLFGEEPEPWALELARKNPEGFRYNLSTDEQRAALDRAYEVLGRTGQLPEEAPTPETWVGPEGGTSEEGPAGGAPPWTEWTEPLRKQAFQQQMADVSADIGRRLGPGGVDSSVYGHAAAGAAARAQQQAWQYGLNWAKFQQQKEMQDWQQREQAARRRMQGWMNRQQSAQGWSREERAVQRQKQQWWQFIGRLGQQNYWNLAETVAQGLGPEAPDPWQP